MDALKKGWYSDVNPEWPGQAFSLEVEEVLHQEKTQETDILIFKSKTYGRVMVLDGVIECTERDEFAYSEMMAHLPMFCHPNPKSVLIVGGENGGIAREVAKHSCVQEILICDVDERVIEVSQQFMPQTGVGFSSPKVQIHDDDGVEFVAEKKRKFDIIITDSPDPVGPAARLFNKPYYENLKASLNDGGIICSQGDCVWLDDEVPRRLTRICRRLFPVVGYALGTVPSIASGVIGYVLASNDKDVVLDSPVRRLTQSQVEAMGLKYYNSDVHKAAFTLPQFVKRMISPPVKKK